MEQISPRVPNLPEPALAASSDSQLIKLWLSLKTSPHTRRAYSSDIARFLAFAQKPLSQVTLPDLQAWINRPGQGILKPATQNRALVAIKSLLSFAHETGYLPWNIGAAVKLQPNRNSLSNRILEESDVRRLIAAGRPGRNRVLLSLLYVSGARVSEICGLNWSDVQPRREGGQIAVFGKGGRTRTILLKPQTWQQLLSIRDGAPAPSPVFRSRKGGGSLDPSQVRRIVYAAARQAGIEHQVSPHWLRHAHASHALDRNAPLHLVQATLGHSSVSTTGRYLHARPTDSSSLYLWPDEPGG